MWEEGGHPTAKSGSFGLSLSWVDTGRGAKKVIGCLSFFSYSKNLPKTSRINCLVYLITDNKKRGVVVTCESSESFYLMESAITSLT